MALRIASVSLVVLTLAVSAQAATITVTPSLAPNAFGSPSYTGWVTNATGALHDGQASRGSPTSPTFYQAQSTVTSSQAIVTNFPSWMGQANPAGVFGAAYANELGNRMLFGLRIDGQGTQFAISSLSFTAVSSDPANALGFSNAAGAYVYSSQYEGVLKGADGVLFTADDLYVTGGDASQLVDGLVGRGSGSSFAAICNGCTTQEQQAAITDAASYIEVPTTFTGTYSLGLTSGSGSFTILPDAVAVPEPASWMVLTAGLALVSARKRRNGRATA